MLQYTSCYEAKENVVLRKPSPAESELNAEIPPAVPEKAGLTLQKGERIVITETKTFLNTGKAQPFGLVRKITSDGAAENSFYWVTILPDYMQPLQSYQALTSINMRVVTDISLNTTSPSSTPVPDRTGQLLLKGERVLIRRTTHFLNGNKVQPFGLAQRVSAANLPTGDSFWISLLPQYMQADNSAEKVFPSWILEVIKNAKTDRFYQPRSAIKVAAGALIGYPGLHLINSSSAVLGSEYGLHIELLIQDPNLAQFLTNPGKVTDGEPLLR